METDRDFLRRVSLFRGIDDRTLQQVAAVMRTQHYRKKVTIFHVGDPGNALFILKRGVVKLMIESIEQKELIMQLLYPTDFFGEMSLIDELPQTITVATLEPTDSLVLYREHFIEVTRRLPEIWPNMAAVLSRRLRATYELIQSLAFFDVYGKVAQMLLTLAAQRGRRTMEGVTIDLRLTRQELAALAGMTRETMARALREFQHAGVIRIESGIITILDFDMLSREVS
jgi:CRP/FNR family transcriptional regulator/CRP/FNR family cyclic AMP-dependent transcriptional regulator